MKVLLKINFYCFLLLHRVSNFVAECYRVGQAWFSLCKCTLTTPNNLPVLNVFVSGLQDNLLLHLPMDQGKDKLPIMSQVLLLFLLENRSDTCFLLFFRTLSVALAFLKADKNQSYSVTGRLPQH